MKLSVFDSETGVPAPALAVLGGLRPPPPESAWEADAIPLGGCMKML